MKLIKQNTLLSALVGIIFTLIPVCFYYLIKYHERSLSTDIQMLILGSVLLFSIPMIIVLSFLFINTVKHSVSLLKTNSQLRYYLPIIISIIGLILLTIEFYKYCTILLIKLDELLRLG